MAASFHEIQIAVQFSDISGASRYGEALSRIASWSDLTAHRKSPPYQPMLSLGTRQRLHSRVAGASPATMFIKATRYEGFFRYSRYGGRVEMH
jgi:hypothetical protein